MDQSQISRIINETLKGLENKSSEIFFEEDDTIRVVVVSNAFIGVRLLKRIETLSQLFAQVSANDLFDYHMIFNPLTVNEKEFGVSETEASNSSFDGPDAKIAKSNHPTY
jgi:stress-induced morphogen